ncbi:MAG: glycogen synthase [Candidatus Marinimicrobia bacterium]|nr:glycogen synthase [Candidatus Neomarinimicrobiota bacterium]
MNIGFVAAEVAPYSKAGGLADVAGSLPQAISAYVSEVHVFTPLYGVIDAQKHNIVMSGIVGTVRLGEFDVPYSVDQINASKNGVKIWFIKSEKYFSRNGIYTEANGEGYEDNNQRFIFFQLVMLDLLIREKFKINVLHCNDHHTGLLPSLIKAVGLKIRTVFTIHNFLYQGHFSNVDRQLLPEGLYPFLTKTQWDNYSALLEGVDHADIVNTVSPGYAQELLDGNDLDEHSLSRIRSASKRFSGIINGIDMETWNPSSDSYTPFHFSIDSLAGKAENKQALLKMTGLDSDINAPVLGSISRLVENKGFLLILEVLDEFVAQGAKFIFLGSGDPGIAKQLQSASQKHPGRIAFDNGYNEPLAHLIESGCDMFLMPSRFEPCGLNQLYSLRYGTIPIVNKTGGLGDTVQNWKLNSGTGFVFEPYSAEMLRDALARALTTFKNKKEWATLVRSAMLQNYSWDQSAKKYIELYQS